jgi:hypothetical protein
MPIRLNVTNSNDATGCYCRSDVPSSNWGWGSTQTYDTSCSGSGIAGQFVTGSGSQSIFWLLPAFGFVQNGAS